MVVGGEGRCVTRKAAMGGRYNLPENRAIGFLICVWPDRPFATFKASLNARIASKKPGSR